MMYLVFYKASAKYRRRALGFLDISGAFVVDTWSTVRRIELVPFQLDIQSYVHMMY
jgi:hypothetical protein